MNQQVQEPEMSWPDVIEAAREKFLEIAPRNMEFTAERAFAIQQLKNNDYLMACAKKNKASLQAAMLNVAAIGLSLNPAKKQAYLVPRGGAVCLDASYMGLCDIATMSGSIKWLQANVVYSNDEFMDNGPGIAPTHKYSPFAKLAQRGDFAGVYCVAKTADGDFLTTIMTADEVMGIKMRSELGKKNSGPWATDFLEQAKKTVVRRAYKMLPKTDSLDRMSMAVELSNQAEGFEPIKTSPKLNDIPPDRKAYFDDLITKSDALEMFVFTKTLDEATFTNLYHSFEKGQKGKYQKIVDELTQKGFAQMRDISEQINDLADDGEEIAIAEAVQGFSTDAIEHLIDLVTPSAASMIRKSLEAA
jgi:phage RecT family recombinase